LLFISSSVIIPAMARCFLCLKTNQTGYRVSHSAIKTKRVFRANLHKLRMQYGMGVVKRTVCSKCYKRMKNIFWEGKPLTFTPLSFVHQKGLKEKVPAVEKESTN